VDDGRSSSLATGAGPYLLGPVGVTVARKVPLNAAPAAAGDEVPAALWQDHARRWTRWKHVRTLPSLAAATAFLAAAVTRT
jgi:uncharacterized membrane protein